MERNATGDFNWLTKSDIEFFKKVKDSDQEDDKKKMEFMRKVKMNKIQAKSGKLSNVVSRRNSEESGTNSKSEEKQEGNESEVSSSDSSHLSDYEESFDLSDEDKSNMSDKKSKTSDNSASAEDQKQDLGNIQSVFKHINVQEVKVK